MAFATASSVGALGFGADVGSGFLMGSSATVVLLGVGKSILIAFVDGGMLCSMSWTL